MCEAKRLECETWPALGSSGPPLGLLWDSQESLDALLLSMLAPSIDLMFPNVVPRGFPGLVRIYCAAILVPL